VKRPDEEQRFREERAAERDGAREPRPAGPARRRNLAGRDALRITVVERTAVTSDPDPATAARPIDLDMRPRDVASANRWRAYISGWRVGARQGAPDPKATGHADRGIADAYQAGYDDGSRAFGAAALLATELYGYVPSVLRESDPEQPSPARRPGGRR